MLTLPTEKEGIKTEFWEYTKLFVGPPKVGKSTVISQAEDVLILGTDSGLKGIEGYKRFPETWDDLRGYYVLVASGKHEFKNVAIDDLQSAYKMALCVATKEAGKKFPSDVGYRRAYYNANFMIIELLQAFSKLPYGLLLTAHSRTEEVEGATGTYSRKTIGVEDDKKRGLEIALTGFVDMIFQCERVEEEDPDNPGKTNERRYVRTKGSQYMVAGGRMEIPDYTPLNYQAIKTAFEESIEESGKKKPNKKGENK